MRDHKKLRAFILADELAISIYKTTMPFPREEQFGLTSQLRRAAVSVPSNIVEGSARKSQADYLHFLDIAYGSCKEVEYQISLAHKLGYLTSEDFQALDGKCAETARLLNRLITSLRPAL